MGKGILGIFGIVGLSWFGSWVIHKSPETWVDISMIITMVLLTIAVSIWIFRD